MRKVALLLAAVAAALSVADYLAWRSCERRLVRRAATVGVFRHLPALEAQLQRQTEPARAATLLAWGLLDLELDRRWLEPLTSDQRAAEARLGIDRLRLAARLAQETLPRRPAAWRAAMALGVARYLEAERGGEGRLERSTWRRPLLAAMRLAPGHREPPLFLASALLSHWSSLSGAEREAARPILARALDEPGGLDLLLERWARLAPSFRQLREVVPDRPQAWRQLALLFLSEGDLERFGEAHELWLASLPDHFGTLLAEAERRIRAGDSRRGVGQALEVAKAPPDTTLAPAFARALALLPEGPASERNSRHLERWLLWALDLCLLGECPLPAETLRELASRIDRLHPARAALVALVTGDAAGAAIPEAAGSEEDHPDWRRYRILGAERLAAADPAAARRLLAEAKGAAGPLYWRASAAVAEASGDPAALEEARRQLDRLSGVAWPPDAWSYRRPSHLLILRTVAPARALRLAFVQPPAAGAAIELRWDGNILGVGAVGPGEELLWRLPVEPGFHQLEITNLSEGALRPGELSLETHSPG